MTHRLLAADEIGYPAFPATPVDDGGYFSLSSHQRAREALRFGLDMPGIGFNAFVIGEDRSGRMDATRELLDAYVRQRPPQDDWVYLNNFQESHRPQPVRLPAGVGGLFRERMIEFAARLRLVTPGAALALADAVVAEFSGRGDLWPWLVRFRRDVEQRTGGFAQTPLESMEAPERRYAVNLLVDHGDAACPTVVVEPNPTYRNLFGCIEYVQSAGVLVTDFTMIRAGALHRANGGILVLRAEALGAQAHVWEALKGALRDRRIRIEEPHRTGTVPLASAPRPLAIPLDAKVIIVGAPRWYYGWFLNDPESRVYFKVKADICGDLQANAANIAAYAGMIRRSAASNLAVCDDEAVTLLLGMAARWAGHRHKLSSRLELLDDLIGEAALISRRLSGEDGGQPVVTRACVDQAAAERRRRVAQLEDRLHRSIAEGVLLISTAGTAVAQVNALIVFDKVDHQYGCPCRVTARSWIGQRGVINIERDVDLGGPIQHKGVLGLHGYLAGCFARVAPVSFSCSVTFEQNYGGIEGDSASLAEALAILSDLSGVALRQDLAVTGSVNQHGEIQPVSGVNHKIEGFFRTCLDQGGLSGTQGVVIPESTVINVVLRSEIADAVAAGRFHVWAVTRLEDAVTLFTGLAVDEVYRRVATTLGEFDRILADRERGLGAQPAAD